MLRSFEDDPEEIEIALQRFRREVQAMGQVKSGKPMFLVLLFSFKGEVIIANPLTIVWIAVPILSVT